jgi:hypothetical protein
MLDSTKPIEAVYKPYKPPQAFKGSDDSIIVINPKTGSRITLSEEDIKLNYLSIKGLLINILA